MAAASLASIMRDQIALSVTCFDRLYLNGYVPTPQTPGQLVRFLSGASASARRPRPSQYCWRAAPSRKPMSASPWSMDHRSAARRLSSSTVECGQPLALC